MIFEIPPIVGMTKYNLGFSKNCHIDDGSIWFL
jgi:hypothetical protein